LRAKTRYTQWEEEHKLVRHEMEWTVKYFRYWEQPWQKQRLAVTDDMVGAMGLRCYASKQGRVWRTYSENAMAWFWVEIPGLQFVDW
jgi:hypothetical protein